MTDTTNLAYLEAMVGEITKIIKSSSIAYQICDVQESLTPAALVFGVKKTGATTGFTIAKKTPVKKTISKSEGFTGEVLEDIQNLFLENAGTIIETISANEILDDLDTELMTYLGSIATIEPTLALDFSAAEDNKDLLAKLIYKISKHRNEMAKTLRRGLPKDIIVSGDVASLLMTAGILSGGQSYLSGTPDNIKFLGNIGDFRVFNDLSNDTDSVIITHKTFVSGDASVILIPINEPIVNIVLDKESGQNKYFLSQRYSYSRNPVDTSGTNDSLFVKKFNVTITGL